MLMCTMFFTMLNAQENFVSGGRTRSMIVYAPKNLAKNRPLLISMHGYNQDAGYQSGQANYQAVADTAKFVVVYPNGEGRSWDLGGNKDINFILDIIDEMYNRYHIDKSRVYLSGFSMGGMMTYYAATKIADKIAAFAPVSGYNMGGPNTNSSRPIPIIHVHGTGDDVCSYSPVQSHLDAWVKRNKCDATPLVINPYPKGTSSTATMYRYRNGLEGVEVAHLKLPGKGHWHSNDPAFAMTNVEVWNFCKRFSLLSGPEMQAAVPENGSFDMMSDKNREFVITFDKGVLCSSVKATLVMGTSKTVLDLAEEGESKTLTFSLPEGTSLEDGTYTLKITGIESADGGTSGEVDLTYTYGVEEVGEVLNVDTILMQDWYSQMDVVGEGIPKGWYRVNTRDGGKDEQKSGAANTGGARLKYFEKGGDFDAGFYLSARDYDKVDFTYGKYSGNYFTPKKGKYILSFNSVYWNTGAMNDKNTFSVAIVNSSTSEAVCSAPSLLPEGCMDEKSDRMVTGSQHHEIEVNIPSTARYLLQFSMASGWNAVIISEPMITTCPSSADRYKGGFLRTLAEAKAMSVAAEQAGAQGYEDKIEALNQAIKEYESFASISPSEYVAATDALKSAMKPVEPVAIAAVKQSAVSANTYDLMGRLVTGNLRTGIYIRNGKKIFVK